MSDLVTGPGSEEGDVDGVGAIRATDDIEAMGGTESISSAGADPNSVWDEDNINKYLKDTGEHMWKCLWCGKVSSGWNVTKVRTLVCMIFHMQRVLICSKL